MLGYDRNELRGKKVSDLSHSDELESSAEALRPLLAGVVESVEMQRRFRHKEGHYIWTHAISSLIRDREGKPASVVSVVQDVTERKRAEESLHEADRRKDEFLATLAHELRNPLAPICNSLHILRLAEGDAASHQDVVEMMERQVQHMVRLVDDLLEVSRITRDKIELRLEQVELAAVVRSAVEASRPMIEAAQHQLAITLPREPVVLNADPVRLSQVFANLLNNAAKYTDSGGQIWLAANVQPKPELPAEVIVSIRDTGIGISPAMLPRVFDMFAQSDSSYERAKGGLGIGLTLVKKLVQLHGGSVEAHSEGPGCGSELVVRLPLAEPYLAKTAALSPQSSQPQARPSQLSILVVDDNQDAANSLAIILQRLGLRVHVVYDGLTALRSIIDYRPSVVLLDIGMPGMDGYEVIRQARLQLENDNVMFIALTGWGQNTDRRRSKDAGFAQHLIKPVDLPQLYALLDTLSNSALQLGTPAGIPQ